ncbi:MFS transporter [Dyadobacter sp. CY356]|uniref:MFS transporter n=1 Tax=Dyadobacter sp. CY356 TaxID=2906442 RepID=UPI001F28BE0A|nr:MFS transporter [Dyadobacter sp. CY356]MCF0058959.1 MFS transporter [Dyadobacter sp. CY356]
METLNETLLVETVAARKWLVFSLCMITYILSGTVSTLMSVYLPVAIPDLMHREISEAEMGEIGAFINATFLYGWMFGGLLFGLVSDRVGRVKTLAFCTALYGVGTCLVVIVPNWYSLMGLRFMTGMGVGGVLLVSTVYISEIWEKKTRPVMLGILAVSFPIGIVATGSLNMVFSAWRPAFGLGLLPVAIALLILFLAPESHSWRMVKSAPFNNTESVFDATNRSNLIKGSVIFGAVLIGLWGIFSWLPTWVQSLLAVGQDGQKERGLTMVLLGMGGITGGVLSGFLVKNLGSRKTLMITFAGCIMVCCLLFITNHTFSKIVYLETALLALFFGISQGSLSSYIPELFPVIIRATATGFCFNIGRFFTATAVFFIGALVTVLGGFGNALLVFSIPFLIAFITAWLSRDPVNNIKNIS